MQRDFAKCNVLIYDENDTLLCNVKIWEHNVLENYIVVQDWPELAGVEQCKLLILTAPAPFSYIGAIRKYNFDKQIKLFEEHMEESRREIRYKTDLQGNIDSLIHDGKCFPLHTKLEVRIINISKSGMRILAKENTLSQDSRFQINVKIGENDKLLTSKIVNSRNTDPEYIEHGCRLVSMDGEINEQ
jgi:hypothetical protein